MSQKRTNLWDYLKKVAEERTDRVEARNATTQAKVEAGVDANTILKDAVAEYGDDVIAAAMAGASAYTGVPLGGATPAAAPTSTPRTGAGFSPGLVSRPSAGASSSGGLPSWAPYAAGGVLLLVLLRNRA